MPTDQRGPPSVLHVYVVPVQLWQQELNTTFSNLLDGTISAGVVRPGANMTLVQFREYLEKEVTSDFLPDEYVFCKNVGHSLGRIRTNQEELFQIRDFLPPASEKPELYVIDKNVVKGPGDRSDQLRRSSIPRIRTVEIEPIEPSAGNHKEERAQTPSAPEPQTTGLQSSPEQPDHTQKDLQPTLSEIPEEAPSQHSQPYPVQPYKNEQSSSTAQLSSFHFLPPRQEAKDLALESLTNSIEQQRAILMRLEREQQQRLIQLRAEEDERRRQDAEAYEREMVKMEQERKRMELLEERLRQYSAESQAARNELRAAKKLWETALSSKESEIETLRENLELMRANNTGRETAAMAAAQSEIRELRNQLREMQDRYTEVQKELEDRRKKAEERMNAVSSELDHLRRKMSLVYDAVKEPPKVQITMVPDHTDSKVAWTETE
ncbi:unnamed protein product [Dicrocoelium dendriticum]|nr:unnamed protein product [Dicrocoelium dendriticum]